MLSTEAFSCSVDPRIEDLTDDDNFAASSAYP